MSRNIVADKLRAAIIDDLESAMCALDEHRPLDAAIYIDFLLNSLERFPVRAMPADIRRHWEALFLPHSAAEAAGELYDSLNLMREWLDENSPVSCD